MTLSMSSSEFMDYSNEERSKWERFFTEHPQAFAATVQCEGDFRTVWDLIVHIFLVEQRHGERLRGAESFTTSTGANLPDGAGLFSFARAARAQLVDIIESLKPDDADVPREYRMRHRLIRASPRKLILHALMHEVRHWAQIATAVRNAGFTPPGDHDLLLTSAFE